jgi:hypothetical protein
MLKRTVRPTARRMATPMAMMPLSRMKLRKFSYPSELKKPGRCDRAFLL